MKCFRSTRLNRILVLSAAQAHRITVQKLSLIGRDSFPKPSIPASRDYSILPPQSNKSQSVDLSVIDARWQAWIDAGFAEEDSPSVQECCRTLLQAKEIAVKLRGEDRLFKVARLRCIHPMVKHITQYSQHSALLELDPQELASVISSTAILGGRLNFCKEIDFLLKVLQPHVSCLDAKSAKDLLVALARADHYHTCLTRLIHQIPGTAWQLKRGGLTLLLWACARLNVTPKVLLDSQSFEQQFQKGIKQMTAAHLLTCLWSLTVLNQTDTKLFFMAWRQLDEVAEIQGALYLRHTQEMQMLQVLLSLKHEGRPTGLPYSEGVESILNEDIYLLKEPKVSSQQRGVADCLTSLGLEYTQEEDFSGLIVDIYLRRMNLVIELDGPSHFARNGPQMLGPTMFKHRLLRAMGMKVLSIPINEWDRFMDLSRQRKFLEAAFKRLGIRSLGENHKPIHSDRMIAGKTLIEDLP